jgi:hypothetical protein
MTNITVSLPDELAQQAKSAGGDRGCPDRPCASSLTPAAREHRLSLFASVTLIAELENVLSHRSTACTHQDRI